uniref:Uncharacterized protein n=1 Tax=Crocodylus porosus TaxID=8502 RepID=A0A7M4F0W2_CROPO
HIWGGSGGGALLELQYNSCNTPGSFASQESILPGMQHTGEIFGCEICREIKTRWGVGISLAMPRRGAVSRGTSKVGDTSWVADES